MPDLSLLEPLSKELDISLNELLAGEEIEKEKIVKYSEQNLISTIDYSTKTIKFQHRKVSIFIIIIGILFCIGSFTVFLPESSWGEIYSILGLLLIVTGIYRELNFSSVLKKILVSSGFFLLVLGIFFVADYIGVSEFKRPPIYKYMTETTLAETKIIEYRNLFYHVYRINADTPNEYYIIDTKKEYTIDTVPTSPFNRDTSGIEQIIKYQSHYVGDSSNTGNLIGALPLSEYGYVFEIDSENCGITIDYHFTDWYGNENLYTEKALIYNSVSAFALIENLEYIQFNFSGSTYDITRETIEQNYPHYTEIVADGFIDKDNFNTYVEQKMNDNAFVTEVFSLNYPDQNMEFLSSGDD